MAEAGDFELLRAYITVQLERTQFMRAVNGLSVLAGLHTKLTSAPWRINVQTSNDLVETRDRVRELRDAFRELPRRQINVRVRVPDKEALAAQIDKLAAGEKNVERDINLRQQAAAADKLAKSTKAVKEKWKDADARQELEALKESGRELQYNLQKVLAIRAAWDAAYKAADRATKRQQDAEEKAETEADIRQNEKKIRDRERERKRLANERLKSQQQEIRKLTKSLEAEQQKALQKDLRLRQVGSKKIAEYERRSLVRKLQTRTATASVTGGTQADLDKLLADIDRASAGATQKQRRQLNALKGDVKLLLKELQAEQKKVEAQNLRLRQVPAKKIANHERKAAAERERLGKEFEKSMREQEQQRKEDLAKQRRYYNSRQEVISKGLFEIRRNLHGFGPASAVLSRNLTRDQMRFADANYKLRQALAKGDFGEIKAAGAEMDALATKTRRLAMVLSSTQLGIRIFKTGMGLLRGTVSAVATVVQKLISPIIALGRVAVRTSLNILQAGLRALLAPTLALISAFQRMAAYLPLIIGYGLIQWIRSAVTTFVEFNEEVTRAAGQMGLFGEAGVRAASRMSTGIRQLASKWLVGQQDMAVAMEELARGGITAGIQDQQKAVAVMLSALEDAAAIKLALGGDIRDAAKSVVIMRAQFGTLGTEADDTRDAILKMTSLIPGELKDLTQGFMSAGAAMRNMGNSSDEIGAALVKMMQNIYSGSKAGSALSRGVMVVVDPVRVAAKELRTLNIDMKNFMDTSQQAFSQDGFIRFVEKLTQAGAGAGNLFRIFGFRAREVVNLLNVDPRGLNEAQRSVRQIRDDIVAAQKEDFADKFVDLIRNRTLWGTVQRLINGQTELKLAFTEAFQAIISTIVSTAASLVESISHWLRTSAAVKAIHMGLLRTMIRLRDTVGPIVAQFVRLVAIVNTGLIGGIVVAVEKIATALQPKIAELARKIETALKLPAGTLDSWEKTGDAIGYILQNLEAVVEVAVNNIRRRLIALAIHTTNTIRKILDPGSGLVTSINNTFQAILNTVEKYSIIIGTLIAQSIYEAIKLGIKSSRVALNSFLTDYITAIPDRILAKAMDVPLEDVRKFRDKIWAPPDDNAINNFAQNMYENAASAMAKIREQTNLTGPGQFGDVLMDWNLGLLDMLANADRAGAKLREALSPLDENSVDQLSQVNKALAVMDERVRTQARQFERDAKLQIKSEIVGAEEFQKLLQQGDLQRDMLNEMRIGNAYAKDMYTLMSQMRQDQLSRNPNVSGGQVLVGR